MQEHKFSFYPITEEAALEIACNLREDDYKEIVEGYGEDPIKVIPEYALGCEVCEYFTAPNGKIGGLAGIYDDGMIWMLCTPVITEYPVTFARTAKKWLAKHESDHFLWNVADKRNTVHLKLLEFLGFSFLREVKHGPNKLTFIEFCKWTQLELD